MNVPLKLEHKIFTTVRQSLRACAVVSKSSKEDPYHNFALKQKAEAIHSLLGFKLAKARNILRRDRALAQKPLAHYTRINEILKPFKPIFHQTPGSVNVFHSTPHVIRRNCQFLEECGATKAPADIIAGCQNYMTVPVGVFKSYAHMDASVSIEDKWLDLLEPSWREETKKCLEKLNKPCNSISYIRNVIFASYVAQEWKLPFDVILEWVEEGVKNLPLSIKRLMKVLPILSDIGFSQGKLWRHPALLRSDPDSLELFVRTYKEDFLGQRAVDFLLSRPLVTSKLDFATVHANVDSLRKFGVPAVCIRNNLTSLLSHDSLTLQEKLRQLEPYPELGVFVHHPKFGRLFDDVDTIVLRVETFRAIDKRQITFTACTCSAKEFSALIQQRAQLRVSHEALGYLANCTGYSKFRIRDVLRSHPHSKQLSTENMKEVIELVVSRGFTKEQIFNGLHLVLYPVEFVAEKLDELPSRPELQPIEAAMKEPNILQIVLYFLEEKFMFTGNGVFVRPLENEDSTWNKAEPKPVDE